MEQLILITDPGLVKLSLVLGAGAGTFLAYATYMTQQQGAVRLGMITPVINNFVRLVDMIL